MDQKGPKTTPKMNQLGSQMVSKWSRWAQNGQEGGLRRLKGAKGAKEEPQGGVHGVKTSPFWESKRGQNPSKNVFENMMVFKSLSGSILGLFASKMAPQSAINGIKIDQKIASS